MFGGRDRRSPGCGQAELAMMRIEFSQNALISRIDEYFDSRQSDCMAQARALVQKSGSS
jgi:hypothetical protein